MSADLFAAFGAPPSDTATKQVKPDAVVGPSVVEQEQSWILQSRPIARGPESRKGETLWKQDGQGTDILFDASDNDLDEEDFGDFEDPPPEIVRRVNMVQAPTRGDDQVDLLGLNDDSPVISLRPRDTGRPIRYSEESDRAQNSHQHRFGQHDLPDPVHFEWGEASNPTGRSFVQRVSSLDVAPETDDWGNFEDVQTVEEVSESRASPTEEQVQFGRSQKPSTPEAEGDDWDDFEDEQTNTIETTHAPSDSPSMANRALSAPIQVVTTTPSSKAQAKSLTHERPSNIPPPFTLLQLLPQVYKQLQQQSRAPSPPASLGPSVQKTYKTSARIMAGRAHRWKRDTRLAQSTRISQAGVKSSGMKLTALDRGESIKEDQEAAEAVAAWQRHAAQLNAVMVKAKVQKPPIGLGAKGMAVRSASGPGVVSARECCAICGLKRNERVVGIDVEVEDTFGEFWVEFWGHRDCYEFWYEYECLLKQR